MKFERAQEETLAGIGGNTLQWNSIMQCTLGTGAALVFFAMESLFWDGSSKAHSSQGLFSYPYP